MPTYTGTAGNDAFAPTLANMGLSYIISSNGGDDTMSGGNVNDSIYLGAGNDIGYGKDGADFIDGGSGNDSIQGQNGNDTMYGGSGDDYIYGGSGDDVIHGQSGLNYLIGEGGSDSYYVDFNNTPRLDLILDSSGLDDKLILSNVSGLIYFDRDGNDLYLSDGYDMQDGYMDEFIMIVDFYNGSLPGFGLIEKLIIGSSTWNLWDLASGVT